MADSKVVHKIELTDRLFNMLKMRERLLIADAALRPIAFFWVVVAVAFGAPLADDPTKFAIFDGFLYSVLIFSSYYALIGGVRRSTEKFLNKLAAEYDYDLSKGSLRELQAKLDKEKPFKDSDDPWLVRFLFGIARVLHLPRRGLVQALVVFAQFAFLAFYVWNYYKYFGHAAIANFPAIMWKMHGAVTLFGLLMMIKNASFLLNNKFFLTLAKGVLDLKGSGERAIDAFAKEQEAIKGKVEASMTTYRMVENDPLVAGCGGCVKNMAAHVAQDVAVMPVPTIVPILPAVRSGNQSGP